MKILLCEDYSSFAKMASEILSAASFPVTRVTVNGHTSLLAVRENDWDVVITDYDLGFGPNGDDVAAEALNADTPLVVLWSSVPRDYPGEVKQSSKDNPHFRLLEKSQTREVVRLLGKLKEQQDDDGA